MLGWREKVHVTHKRTVIHCTCKLQQRHYIHIRVKKTTILTYKFIPKYALYGTCQIQHSSIHLISHGMCFKTKVYTEFTEAIILITLMAPVSTGLAL